MSEYLTPPQLAATWGVESEKVLQFIARGLLRAVNLASPGAKRPRWRIPPEAVRAFEESRSARPPIPKPRRRRRRVPLTTKSYF